MKVNSNRDISFKSLYTNKALKKGLEFAADNGAVFAATTTLVMSSVVRPAAIWLSPKTDKENKKIACSKSLASSGVGFCLTYAIATPFAKAIKEINKKPTTYLKPESIKSLQNGCSTLQKSPKYAFATQLFKLGLGLAVAIPKAVFTSKTLPHVINLFKKNNVETKDTNINSCTNPTFKSNTPHKKLAKHIGEILDKPYLQKFSDKFHNSNFPMHIVAATDILTTSTFIHQIHNSDKIEEKRKKALIYNTGFSTILSVLSSYVVDKLMDKPTQNFIKRFAGANKADTNLAKQIEGIKIAKPILLIGMVYYMLIPFISTFLAELAEKDPRLDIPHKQKK